MGEKRIREKKKKKGIRERKKRKLGTEKKRKNPLLRGVRAILRNDKNRGGWLQKCRG